MKWEAAASSMLSPTTSTELWSLVSSVRRHRPATLSIIFHVNYHVLHKVGIQVAHLFLYLFHRWQSRWYGWSQGFQEESQRRYELHTLSSLGLDKVSETDNLTSYIYILTAETSCCRVKQRLVRAQKLGTPNWHNLSCQKKKCYNSKM